MIYINIFTSVLLAVSHPLALYFRLPFATAASAEKENEVKSILQHMEADVLAFRDEVERVYTARCDNQTVTECNENNFNDCSSTFPGQQCMSASELVIGRCGDGINCNGKPTDFSRETYLYLISLFHKTLHFISIMGQAALDSESTSYHCRWANGQSYAY